MKGGVMALSKTLLIRNARVLAPDPLGVKDILIVTGKIVFIAQNIEKPAWVEKVVDCQGRYVIPGLIDLHVHLLGGGGEGGPASRLPEIKFNELAQAGITTCVGCLGLDDVTRQLEDLLAKVRALRTQGVTAFMYTGSYQIPPVTLTGSIKRDLVLIPEIIGIGELAISDHRSSHPTPKELLRIAAEARVGGMLAGKRGLVHLHVGSAPSGLEPLKEVVSIAPIPMSQFHPTHVNRTADLLEQAVTWVQAGGTVDITVPSDTLRWKFVEAVRTLIAVDPTWERFTFSSDGGGSMPVFDEKGQLIQYAAGEVQALWKAVQSLVREGFPLEVVLRPVTVNPARILGIADSKGTISVGKDGDIVVLDENLRVAITIANGTVIYSSETNS